MGIKVTTNFDSYTKQWVIQVEQHIEACLIALGELCDSTARQDGTYNDNLGDLRSSIGYAVVIRGKKVKIGGFGQVKQGSKGARQGKALVRKLAAECRCEYALIVVAGASHAEKVEALDNKIVLVSAELFAKRNAPQILKQLSR